MDYGFTLPTRGPLELEVSLPPTSDDPAWIDTLIAQAQESDMAALVTRQEEARRGAWQRLRGACNRFTYRRLKSAATSIAIAGQQREIVRSGPGDAELLLLTRLVCP